MVKALKLLPTKDSKDITKVHKGHFSQTLICICTLLFCNPFVASAQKNNIVFTDITKKAGIDFKYTFGDYSYENIIESSGSGITVFDYNNDKLMDLYMMNGTYLEGISDRDGKVFKNSQNKLYKNNGNGTFTEVSELPA